MLSRRAVMAGAASLAAAADAAAAGGFPPGFLWGVAASAPQTEGADRPRRQHLGRVRPAAG